MNQLKKFVRLTLAFAAISATVFCSPAVAEVFSLKDLIGTDLAPPSIPFIDSGDKRFDKFEYTATGDMPSAVGVNVSTFTDLDGNFGITFQGAFIDLYDDGPSDALIRYRVTVLDPTKKISDAHIYGNPVAIGTALMSVTETFLSEEPNEHMAIHHVSPGGNVQRIDSAYFDGRYTTMHVQKDITAYAKAVGSAATLSFIDQTFSQVLVPEPSTVVILITGLAFLGCFVRRNRH